MPLDFARDERNARRIAEHIPARPDIAARLVALARPGDRIVVMGARDDTLSQFAGELVERLSSGS